MSVQTPAKADWQQLYELMAEIKKQAPWKLLSEDMVFGVQNPVTSEFGFVSVMGALGEHLSIAVYLGVEALYNFWAVHEEEAEPEQILEIPQLQASFEDREMVTPEDHAVIKELGLKFRGRNAWPLFRSYQPGFLPWYISATEAQFLAHVLQQSLIVVDRLQVEPRLLLPAGDNSYLMRVPMVQNDEVVWQDQVLQVPPPPPRSMPINLDADALEFLRNLSPRGVHLEVDFFMTPAQIQEAKDKRPYFAYSLLLVAKRDGFVLGSQMMKPEPAFTDMLAQVPLEFLYALANIQLRPDAVWVQSPRLHSLLTPVCAELGIRLKISKRLKKMEHVKSSLKAFLSQH